MKLLTMRTLIIAACSLLLSTALYAAEMVNINKADAAAIQQNLVGIGPVKAEAIVSYRKKNGKFKSVADLQNVKGLGPALLKKNKRYLSTSKGAVKGDAKKYAAAKKQASSKASTTTKKPAKKDKKTNTKKDKPVKKDSTKKKPAKKETKPKKKPAKKDAKPKKKKKKPAS